MVKGRFWSFDCVLMPQVLPAFEESSCDDTAAAIVRGSPDQSGEILSNVVWGQSDLHAAFGGVVPEIAARRPGLAFR